MTDFNGGHSGPHKRANNHGDTKENGYGLQAIGRSVEGDEACNEPGQEFIGIDGYQGETGTDDPDRPNRAFKDSRKWRTQTKEQAR